MGNPYGPSISIGANAEGNVGLGTDQAIALGGSANAMYQDSISIGFDSESAASYAVSLGGAAASDAEGAVGIGYKASAPNQYEATFGNLNGEELDVNVTGNLTVHGEELDLKDGDISNIGGLQSCGDNQYVDGLGNCQTDDAGTDNQNLADVLSEGNFTDGNNIVVNGSSKIDMTGNSIENVGTDDIDIGDGEGNIDMNNASLLDTGLAVADNIGIAGSKAEVTGEVDGNDLYVKDDVSVDGDIVGAGADVAETIQNDTDMDSGTVVVLNGGMNITTSTQRRDTSVAGVVSRDPAMVMAKERDGVPIAMTGTVPVKFSDENGAVKPGDFLTTASRIGHAMKCQEIAECQGAIIGKVMQTQSETGEVQILISRG